MSRVNYYKKPIVRDIVYFTVLASIIILFILSNYYNQSQQQGAKTTLGLIIAPDRRNTNTRKLTDEEILTLASEIDLEQSLMGQLAQQNSLTPAVQETGKIMETVFTASLMEVQAIAAKKQVMLPTLMSDNGIELYKELLVKKGIAFDKAYCDKIEIQQHEAIELLEQAHKNSSDTAIRLWAASTIPKLRIHLTLITNLQKDTSALLMNIRKR